MDQNVALQTVGNDDNATAFNETIDKTKDVDKLPSETVVSTLSNGRRDSGNELSHDIEQQPDEEVHTSVTTAVVSTSDTDTPAEIDGHNTDYSSSSSCSTEYGALVINEGSAESNDTNTNTQEAKTSLSQAIAAVKQQMILNSIAEECSSTMEEADNETETVSIPAATPPVATTTSDECTVILTNDASPSAAPNVPDVSIESTNLVDTSESPVSVAMPLINGDHLDSCSSANENIETDVEAKPDEEQQQQQEKQVTMKRKLSCDSETEDVAEKRAKESCDDRVSIDMENSMDSLNNDDHRLDNELMGSNKVTLTANKIDTMAAICETIGTHTETPVTIEADDRTAFDVAHETIIPDNVQTLTAVNSAETCELAEGLDGLEATRTVDTEKMVDGISGVSTVIMEATETEDAAEGADVTESEGTSQQQTVISELVEANKSKELPVTDTPQQILAPEVMAVDEPELADATELLTTPVSDESADEADLSFPDEVVSESHNEFASATIADTNTTLSMESPQTVVSETNLPVPATTTSEILPISTDVNSSNLLQQYPTLPEVIRTIHKDLPIPILNEAIPAITENLATTLPDEPILTIPVSNELPMEFRTTETINSLSYLNGCANTNRSIINTIESEYPPFPSSLNTIKDRSEMKYYLKHQLMFGTISESYFNDYAQCLGLDTGPKFKCFKCDANQFQSLTELKTHQLVCLRSLDNNNVDNINDELEQSNLSQRQFVGGSMNDALKLMSTATTTVPSATNQASHAEAKAHLRIRRQVFLCAACGTYWEKWQLFYHIREVHKKFICLFCLGIFATAERLVNHLESKHISKPNVYEHKDGLMSSLKDQCYLMCCVCEHIFSECDDFTGHSCENYMAPCAHCALKFIHKPNCSFAIKNKLMVKKTAPIAMKPMMATLDQHRQQQMRTKLKSTDDSRRTPRNGELLPTPIVNANHLAHYERPDAIEKATVIRANEPSLLINTNNNKNAFNLNELPAKEQDNPNSDSSDDDASSDAADSSSDDSDTNDDNSNSESEQSPVKGPQKFNEMGGEQKVETLKLKLSNIRNPIYTESEDSNSNDESAQNEYNDSRPESDRNKSNFMNENIAFQITAGNEDIGADPSNHIYGAPLLVPKLKLKIVKDFQLPVESDESSTTESDDEANDDDVNNGDFDDTNSNEVATNDSTDQSLNVTGDSENMYASSSIMDVNCLPSASTDLALPMNNRSIENQAIEPVAQLEQLDEMDQMVQMAQVAQMEPMDPREPIENHSAIPSEVLPNETAPMDSEKSVAMDIDDELQFSPNTLAHLESPHRMDEAPNLVEPAGPASDTNDDGKSNIEPLSEVHVSPEMIPQELSESMSALPEVNDASAMSEENEIPEEAPIEVIDHRQIIDLLLDQPLDKMPVKQFIRKCLSVSFPVCLYCNYARKIAVDGISLAQHLVNNHRFAATVDSITAEELLPSTIEQRLKCSVDELNATYFNLDSYDYKNDEPQPQPFIKTFECLQCRFQSLVYKDLYLHNRKMHLRAALICHMCKSNFFSYSELVCHMCPGESDKLIPIDLKFRCVLCNLEDIPSAFRLMVHLRKKHFACDVCLEECSDQSKLSCHVWKHKLHHLCYRCNITYRNKADITKHLFWKHGTESVQCKRCLEKKWPHVYHFCVPPTKFTCENCGLIFARAVALKVHKRLHAEDGMSYPCTEDGCEKRFISRKLLLKHVNRHNQPIELAMEIEPSVSEDADVQVTKSPAELREEALKGELSDGDRSELVDATAAGDKSNEQKKQCDAAEGKSDVLPVANDNDGSSTVDLQLKQKEKKQKKKKITDLLGDLPTLNLSESDSSDDSENESSITNSALIADHSMQSFSSTLNANCSEVIVESATAMDEDEDVKPIAPIVDIWENFKSYQASQMHDKQQDIDDDGLLCETPSIIHVNQSDHDYCMMYKPLKKAAKAVLAHSTSVPFVQINDKGDINVVYVDIEPEQPVEEKEIITEETKDIKELEAEKKVKENLSGSDSSSSSSDSDSSSCSNCDSNCSCSSSSSGSSSSSSDSDSDSSKSNDDKESPKKNLKSKKVRDQERAALSNRQDADSIGLSPKKEPSPIRDRLKSETDVVDVDVESTDARPPVVNIDPDTIINESDLETAESDTDEDFYDDHPQKMANIMLAEKRRELLYKTEVNPYNTNEIVENSRPSTPSLPEEVAREQRIKIKKRKKVRKNSKNVPLPEKVHIPVEVPQAIMPDPISIAPVISEAPLLFGMNVKPLTFTHNAINSFAVNALPPTNSPIIVNPLAATALIADTRKHLISESRLSTSSCSDADTSLKRSKRRRIPNKFYGYTSDEEGASLLANSAGTANSLNPFKPIPPPNLTWSKEDLPDTEPAKIVHTPPIKTIIRLPPLNISSTPKIQRAPMATKGKPKGRAIKKTPNNTRKSVGSQKQIYKPKLNQQRPAQPLVPPLIIRSNSLVKPSYAHRPSEYVPPTPVIGLTPFNESYPVRVHMMPQVQAHPLPPPPPQQQQQQQLQHQQQMPPQNESDNSSSDSDSDSSDDEVAAPSAPLPQPPAPLQTQSQIMRTPFMQSLHRGSLVNSGEPLLATHLSHIPSLPSVPSNAIPTAQHPFTYPSNPMHANANATMIQQRFPMSTPPASHPAREGESVYCYCRCPYDGVSEMIGCDGTNCRIEWFHFECVNIVVAPSDKWYCPECKPKYENGDETANDAAVAAAKLPTAAHNFINNLVPHVQPSANNTFTQQLSPTGSSSCITPTVT